MNRLLAIGFEHTGHWLLQKDELIFKLLRYATQKNILYAFVCDGQIKYIGKTTQSLAMRMSGYKKPGKTQTTNVNNNYKIRQLLVAGSAVDILALPDNGLLHYGQFHLNLAAALEDSIIRSIDPEWNGGRKEKISDTSGGNISLAGETEEDSIESLSTVISNFILTLQPTYYQRGFFNIGVSVQKLIGADGEKIEILLGDSPNPILGSINRSANQNGTPRIMAGVGLRDWFQANYDVMSAIPVVVKTPNSIHLKGKDQ